MQYLVFLLLCVSAPAASADVSAALLRAIESENWAIAAEEATDSRELSSYVEWRRLLDADTAAHVKTLKRFVRQHPSWPQLNRLQLRIEKALFQNNNQSADAKAWLMQMPPISGYGKLALARLTGDHALIRKGWIQGDFEQYDETQIRSEFRASLDGASHRARAERLLREGKASVAESLLNDVGPDYAKLIRARTGLQRKERHLSGKISAVPEKYKQDHGLLADRLQWRHRKGLSAGVRELLIQMDPASPYADRIYRIRKMHVRDAIEAGQYTQAAKLLTNAGSTLNAGNNADALWLRGWLQLRFLKKPRKAYETFYQLYQDVSYPISKARGAFWSARAADASDNNAIAADWYRKAANHPTTFYGQLAFSHVNPGKGLPLPAMAKPDQATLKRLQKHKLWKLSRLFYDAGQYKLAIPLIYHLGEPLHTPGEFTALMALAKDANMLHAQVKIAKLALRKHIILTDGWPIIDPPSGSPLAPELTLAIARQESEFNPIAVSRANARGLMQLLPSTARKVASKLELDYSLANLFDPEFNMRLGSKYLGDLIDGFDGNYILAIAGYNAGPGRSRQWIERFGWPGKNLEDTLTFLELIPFSETRNYVQRVMENAQTYAALRAPNKPLMIEQDLLR